MNKVGQYLQEHLIGEVVDSAAALKFFSTDMSVLEIKPGLIVYPRNENDVRKTARFSWQLAERGRIVPITARGAGTDLSGAAIGSGVVMVFPAHLHHVLDIDNRSGQVIAEPGANFAKVQQALEHTGHFLPPAPASSEYSTIGGAVMNNASGDNSFKYGSMRNFVRSLRLVLANGEVVETGRISKRELNKKLGLATFEGEIYRSLDTLIEENQKLIEQLELKVSKNNTGYALNEVKQKDGSFDLTPLIVGSQGTLGIISEITLDSEAYSDGTTVLAALFSDFSSAAEAAAGVRSASDLPASLEIVDGNLLTQVEKVNPNFLKGALPRPLPGAVLIAEFDDVNEHNRKKALKKCKKILEKYASEVRVGETPDEKEALARIRRSQSVYSGHHDGSTHPVPVIDDGVVPASEFKTFVERIYKLFKDNYLDVAIWGHAGDANLHLQPMLDLSGVGDRQKLFKLMDEYYQIIAELGGSTSGEFNDGRIRAPWLDKVYSPEVVELFAKVKKIFDPYGTLNPGVKIGTNLKDLKAQLRSEYSLDHLYNHTAGM